MRVEDYLALDRSSEVRHEFIDGYAYLLAGGTADHSTISFNMWNWQAWACGFPSPTPIEMSYCQMRIRKVPDGSDAEEEAAMPAEQPGFRETITTSAEARGRFIRQTSGRNLYGDVWLRVEPLEYGNGIEFINALAEGVIPDEYIKPIEEGVREAAENGVLRGLPMTDLRVTLFGGSHHPVDSSAMAFKIAGAIGVKEAVIKANPIVREQ